MHRLVFGPLCGVFPPSFPSFTECFSGSVFRPALPSFSAPSSSARFSGQVFPIVFRKFSERPRQTKLCTPSCALSPHLVDVAAFWGLTVSSPEFFQPVLASESTRTAYLAHAAGTCAYLAPRKHSDPDLRAYMDNQRPACVTCPRWHSDPDLCVSNPSAHAWTGMRVHVDTQARMCAHLCLTGSRQALPCTHTHTLSNPNLRVSEWLWHLSPVFDSIWCICV